MRLNHVNIAVSDVPAARAFLESYFGFRCIIQDGAEAIAVMMDDAGTVVAVSDFDRAQQVSYPGGFHVGFFQNDDARVNEMFERLQADGFASRPPREFHGAWTFYFKAPGGFTVEVAHQRGLPAGMQASA